jgi:hypothetical protein
MPGPLFANNISTTLTAGVGPSDTLLQLASATGVPTPTGGDYFYATLQDTGGFIEIVRCTARSGLTVTATRGQDGTTARSFSAGVVFELRPTAQVMRDLDWRPQRSVASGLAPLDAGSKVPIANLPAGTASGLATLDAGSRVPLAQLAGGIANGLATLDAGTKVPVAQIPNRALVTVNAYASEAAMVAAAGSLQEGDLCLRSDTSTTFVRNSGVAGTVADFTLLPTPTAPVVSVNGSTGAVVVTAAGISAIPTAEKNAANGVAAIGPDSRIGVAQSAVATRVTETGTTRTLSSADHGTQIKLTNAAAITVTAPDTLPDGFYCTLFQTGAGQITVTASGSVTLRARKGAKSAAQFAPVGVSRLENEIYVFGDVVA